MGEKKTLDLTQGTIWKVLAAFILPIIAGSLIQQLYTTVDAIIVGRFVGKEGLAAVDSVGTLFKFPINFLNGMSAGATIIVSRFFGQKNDDELDCTIHTAYTIALILGVVCSAAGAVFAPILLNWLAVPQDIYGITLLYVRIYFAGLWTVTLYNMISGVIRAFGDSKSPLYILILCCVFNVLGDLILVGGLKMGVAGVAWPSVVSRAVAAVLILRAGANPENTVCLDAASLHHVDTALAGRILRIGIPSAFENSLFQAGRILVVAIITVFGTVQISANAVANNLDGFSIIPGQAIGLAMIAVVGRAVGAQDTAQATAYTRKLMLWAYLALGVTAGSVLLFLRPILGLYALSDETLALAMLLIRLHAGFAIFMWPVAFVLPNALRAAGDVNFTMVVSIISMVVWRLGFSYILGLQMGWGAVGVWIGMIVDWVCRLTCFVARFASGAWKTKYKPGA